MARVTVEDCLKKINNRFILVIVSVLRTKQLMKGSLPSISGYENNEQIIALREIAAGNIVIINKKELS